MSAGRLVRLAVSMMAAAGSVFAGEGDGLGPFERHTDIGDGVLQGSVTLDESTGEYTIEGAGANMWGERDELSLVWTRLSGDFILRARARFVGEGVDPHRKMGWIARSSLDPSSAYVDAAVHGDGLAALQLRRSTGAATEEIRSPVEAPDVIQLARSGDTYTLSVARFGDPLVTATLEPVELGDEVYVGLFVCSHNAEVMETAVFSDVRIVRPAPADFEPYRDYIGSRVEILDVTTGRRRIVHSSPESLQAPNWTADGKALIYNGNGRLHRLDLESGAIESIETGFATANNNDHVLSFDGSRLGISHHSADDGGESIVYTLPLEGGEPRRVTDRGPSYLHGWSPDGEWLVYTGGREGSWDIYKIRSAGGEEIRLTDAPGLDDGSEYTPDGEWIYFNSDRTGTMQIWRMRPDGGAQEQVTFDELNDWFPHPSPDGRWLAFLSYGPHVAAGDHPFYEQVYLRLMPLAGGEPRVIAYVYGGQGTINVPSWSPDSRRLAFVSNTRIP
jgi:Tol biopolymer transport system component